MVRYVAVLRRAAGVSREAFLAAWLGEHRRLAGQLPGLLDLQFLPASDALGTDDGPDGIGFLDFADLASLQAGLASGEARALRAHTSTFADSEATVRLVVEVPDP
jgi:hypothetical protein